MYDGEKGMMLGTDVNLWWGEEGMELGKVCCLTCQVPYYPGKPYGVWEPRPWSRIKCSIPVEWHQVWQVVHISHCSKGVPKQVSEGNWCSSCLPHPVHQQESTNTKCEGFLCWLNQTCQVAEDQLYWWHFQRKNWVKEVFQERTLLNVNGTAPKVVWAAEESWTYKG